ncbi:hypothetical protein ABZ876_35935 [Streptomyces sp. NPDC046931]
MISTGRWAPRVSAADSLLAAGMFTVTLGTSGAESRSSRRPANF